MSEAKQDELRSRLIPITARLTFRSDVAIAKLLKLRRIAGRMGDGDTQLAWKKGIDDALQILAPMRETQDEFRRWLVEAVASEKDAFGLTPDERSALLAPMVPTNASGK